MCILHINPIKWGSLRINVLRNIKAYYIHEYTRSICAAIQLLNSFQICFNLGNCDLLYIIICYYTTRAFHSLHRPTSNFASASAYIIFIEYISVPGILTDTVNLHRIYGKLCKNVLTIASQWGKWMIILFIHETGVRRPPVFQCSAAINWKTLRVWLRKNSLQLLETC